MDNLDNIDVSQSDDYIVVKAKNSGVQVIGLTRGGETRSHHTEMLDKGEVLIAQFTSKTSAIKIKGDAEIYTKHGIVESARAEK
ncbi:MAG: trp RNA-binding attenuation protein MtrB [Clostridia bacterium]